MLKLKMRKIKKREWILALIFIIMIGIAAAEKAAGMLENASRGLDEQIALSEEKLFDLKILLRQTNRLNAEYEKLTLKNAAAGSDNLIQEIEDAAKKENVNILNITPSVTRDEAGLKTYSINIQSQEDIADLFRFLSALSENLQRVSVERIRVNAQKKDELPVVLLSLNAVSFKE